MRFKVLIIILLISKGAIFGQETILDNPEIQVKIQTCLQSIYNYDFSLANQKLLEIENQIPGHPVCSFLEGLKIYWENMPLLSEDPQTDEFLKSMEESISIASNMLKKNPNSIEGIFFDLHARAFIAMFWADNGKPSKVIKDIDNLYRRTMQGIDLKNIFNEFFFSSGLYSYYIDAYVDLHPVYKPIAKLFRKGDKENGLKELQQAIDSSTYMAVESLLFMSLLQLNYEKNMIGALEYAAILHNNCPANTYYTGHYLMILLYQNEFELAVSVLQKLELNEDDFSEMIRIIMQGFILENYLNNSNDAEENYMKGIAQADKFGPFTHIYQAIAYAGLSRIYNTREEPRLARRYRKKSKALSKYEFILAYHQQSSL